MNDEYVFSSSKSQVESEDESESWDGALGRQAENGAKFKRQLFGPHYILKNGHIKHIRP